MIEDNTTQWQGIPVKAYNPSEPLECPNRIYRMAFSWDDEVPFSETFPKYLADPACGETVGLSLGLDGESADGFYESSVKALLENKEKFPKMRWLFLGEMTQEESEMTWIGQGDVGAPVLEAFPNLEELHARGGEGYQGNIAFTKTSHAKLKKLALETAGLTREAFRGVMESDFPELETLELWLGCEDRGGSVTIDDVRDLLQGCPFPKLKTLGLMNAEMINEVAKEVVNAPILEQLETLDLSLGVLQDEGGRALLGSEKILSLLKLNLSRHYLSDEVMAEFQKLDLDVDVSDQEEADEWDGEKHYYVAVEE